MPITACRTGNWTAFPRGWLLYCWGPTIWGTAGIRRRRARITWRPLYGWCAGSALLPEFCCWASCRGRKRIWNNPLFRQTSCWRSSTTERRFSLPIRGRPCCRKTVLPRGRISWGTRCTRMGRATRCWAGNWVYCWKGWIPHTAAGRIPGDGLPVVFFIMRGFAWWPGACL